MARSAMFVIRRGLRAALGLFVMFGAALAQDHEASEARMRKDITFLASDECEGRGVDTQGIHKAAEYIVGEFTKAGLKPGGKNGAWYQPFKIAGSAQLQGKSSLKLKGPLGQEIELRPDFDFQVLGLSAGGKVTAPLVFAGFGITAPDAKYDDFKGLDVAGKIVVLLRYTPRYQNKEMPFDGARRDEHAALERKQALAETNKAAAVILVNSVSKAADGDPLMAFKDLTAATPGSIPALQLRRSVLDMIMQASLGTSLVEMEKAIDRDLTPRSMPLAGWTATLDANVKRSSIAANNVIGVLEGAGPLANETVVIGAHYDHLGYGGPGSLAKLPKGQKEIHHGADDNGSGTTSVIELARRFGQMKDRQGRRLVFMTFSGEELGLLGSRHYTNKEPLFPLDSTVAMVNLDMVGRLPTDPKTGKQKLIVEGTGTAKTFDAMIEKFNPGFQLSKKPGGTGPSDHDSFYRKKVPVVFLWTGTHADYHRPSDTSDKINVAGMRQIADLAEKVIVKLSTDTERPEYVQVASTSTPGMGKGPRLGITPNYEEGKAGLMVGGVADDGPAAKAGIKAGDLIVDIGGKAVTNINTYMVLMGQQRLGQTVDVGVIRDGKKLTLKVLLK